MRAQKSRVAHLKPSAMRNSFIEGLSIANGQRKFKSSANPAANVPPLMLEQEESMLFSADVELRGMNNKAMQGGLQSTKVKKNINLGLSLLSPASLHINSSRYLMEKLDELYDPKFTRFL